MIFLSGHALAASSTLHLNSQGIEVTALQQQLKQLGYYPSNLITGLFGSITRDAVIRFQKSKGLQADGIVGSSTYARLGQKSSASNATTSNRGATTPVKTNQVLKHGATGTAVQDLQRSLLTDGFYHSSIDGIFGKGTETAVIALQRSKGLQADGIVGPATLKTLAGNPLLNRGGNSADRPIPPTTPPPATPPPAVNQSGTNEMLSWTVVNPLFARKSTARVIDVDTCIHFLNSRTHGTNNLDPNHQAMVRKAAASTR